MPEIEKQKNFIIHVAYTTIILALIYIVIKYVTVLLTPFLVAFVIAYGLRKPTRMIADKFKINYKTSSFLVVAIFYILVASAIFVIGLNFFINLPDVIAKFPNLYKVYIEPIITNDLKIFESNNPEYKKMFFQFSQAINNLLSNVSKEIIGIASVYASSLPGTFIKILITVISTFFIAADYNRVTEFAFNQMSDRVRELVFCIKDYVINTLFVLGRSYLFIMSVTFVELSIGFTILGISNSVLIALSIAFFDILPVLGTGGIMIPWILINFLLGNYSMALGLLGVYLFVTVVRNILEPKIIGKQIGLPPLATLMSMFVGVQLFGVLGLFGFPITLSLIIYLNEKGLLPVFKKLKNRDANKTQE